MTNDQDKSGSLNRLRALRDHTSHAEIALSNRRHHSLHLSISAARRRDKPNRHSNGLIPVCRGARCRVR